MNPKEFSKMDKIFQPENLL